MKSPLNRSLRTSLLFFLVSSTSTTQAELLRRGQSQPQDEESFSSVQQQQQQRELGGHHRGAYQPLGGSFNGNMSTKSNNDGPTQTKEEAMKEKNNQSSKKERCTLAIREVQLVDQSSYEQIDCLPQSGVTVHVVKGLSSQWLSTHRVELLDGQISAQVPEETDFDSPVTSDMNFDDESSLSEATITIGESDLTIDPSQSLRERRRHLQQHTGVRKVLAVRVQAPDTQNSYTLDTLRSEVFGINSNGDTGADPVNLKTQMEACSHGDLQIDPVIADGISNGVYNSRIKTNSKNQADWVARDAVVAEMSRFSWFNGWNWIDTNVADYVMICIPPGSNGGWIGYAWPNYYVSVYNDKWCLYPSIQMHELGHNLNLAHSGQGTNSYGDQSGMMGYSYGYDDWPAMCFNSAKSWQLGWYQGKRMEFEPITSHTRTLKLYGITRYGELKDDDDDDDEQVLIRIKGGSSKDYYVGFNRKETFNRHTVEGANSVLIVQKTKNSEGYAKTELVATLGNVGNSWSNANFGGSGETFSLTVSSLNLDDGYAEITMVGFQESAPPTVPPTPSPTAPPTPSPTNEPTTLPTVSPTVSPTVPPTVSPTSEPTASPTVPPTPSPTSEPTASPTVPPTPSPTSEPTATPTVPPTPSPTSEPTASPTVPPTPSPTSEPTSSPTVPPTPSPIPVTTLAPTFGAPTKSPQPTNEPTPSPTNEPTVSPTPSPTNGPTQSPTLVPTHSPTNEPTVPPTLVPTAEPTQPPTTEPTSAPTEQPTLSPTTEPTFPPTSTPTEPPTPSPTSTPTEQPTLSPTTEPTVQPTPSPTPPPTFETTTDRLLNMTLIIDNQNASSTRRELQQEDPEVMSANTLSHICSSMEAYLEMSFARESVNTTHAGSQIHVSLRATATSGSNVETTKLRQRQRFLQGEVKVELYGNITMPKDAMSQEECDAKQQEFVEDESSVEQALNAEHSDEHPILKVSSSTAANPTTLAPTSVPTPVPTPKPTKPPTINNCRQIRNGRQCKRSRLRCRWKKRRCRGKKRRLGEEEDDHQNENDQSVWDDHEDEEDYDDDDDLEDDDIFSNFGSEEQDIFLDYDEDEEEFEDEDEDEEFLVATD